MTLLSVAVTTPSICRHCGDSVPRARIGADGSDFCCEGCAAVYSFLRELNFEKTYYSMKGGKPGGLKPVVGEAEDYSSLDRPPFRSSIGEATLEFFIEGIHCTACVWILERLPEMNEEIRSARLDVGRSTLRVSVTAGGKFEVVALLLNRLGYRPHPVRSLEESTARLAESDRASLKRMGVAAFCAMNVMIYSFALYANVGDGYAWLFRIFSLVTALPALTYSAYPFYRSAFRALRGRRISIDLPISMAFICGYAESLRQVLLGTNLVYLDSVTSLVFLMLASRYALSRLERAEFSKSGLLQSLLPARAGKLVMGEVITLKAGEKIPADGQVTNGTALVDLSFLTGETKPVSITVDERVYAGGRLLSGEVRVRIVAIGADTRLGEIETRLAEIPTRMNLRTARSDRWAQVFLASVFGLAVVLLVSFGPGNLDEAIRRSLSLIIVACPCALALATPLTLARAVRLAASRGILVRDPDAFDRVLESDRIIFDKTGTLTTGRPRVCDWNWAPGIAGSEKARLLSIAYTLELRARHPYGRGIVAHLENLPGVRRLRDLSALEEVGTGTIARFEGSTYEMGRPQDFERSGIEFRRDSIEIARIEFSDEIRGEAPEVVLELSKRGFGITLFSGDAPSVVSEVANEVGIADWRSRMSPEQKSRMVEEANLAKAITIGDGVNDSLALRKAFVGVAFTRGGGDSLESTLAACSVAVLRPNLGAIIDLVDISRRYRRTLHRNAAFSVLYNLIGASLAAAGLVHPLVAAIAMPISAVTVFLSTAAGLREPKARSEK